MQQGIDIKEIIVHTGQHYDQNMSDIFFDEMHIPKPDYFLGVGGKTHGQMTGQMIEAIESILIKESPDWVLVYGDTNSTLSGAIAASKLNIKIVHIEAGLRSHNMQMPEEINRILTDRISTYLFCPTKQAVDNLALEGVEKWSYSPSVVLSGDVMQDGAKFYADLSRSPDNLKLGKFILCTIHRAENTDNIDRLANIITALNIISENVEVVLPIHPRTKKVLEANNFDLSKLTLIDPVGYLNMVWFVMNCELVMTDSGGLQKEAYFFRKKCITLRNETEWVELVDYGYNVLVGADADRIVSEYKRANIISDFNVDLYGDGKASEMIIDTLLNHSTII
ncbi:UDP-GlcNAc3NAcA epimerase [Marinomonas aquiplantarum]|uniref:UDP-GlcNAc3NAcA epimerase n=2 Tax=Marinomonas aquiplantarum TaxID=491951 RepID=A0A366D8E1_9GAMM|nr:UDP-GlcNAc3NAcA epimerase [Marinomonas aquiplantarum]